MEEVVEIRSYNLKAGTRQQFQTILLEQALPLLSKWKMEVVAYGPSLHDENSFFLARAYSNLNHRQQSQDAFYRSVDWVDGPREAALALVDNYTTIVIPRKNFNVNDMNREKTETEDHAALSKLNALFIRNFIAQDTVTHNQIIHKDFLCIENSGAIVNRQQYMRDWSHAYGDGNFTSFEITDEHIRIFGNTALVRSRTVYTRTIKGKETLGNSIYTDTYIKENGRWWCVQAQITPVAK
jgi:hypothetical protein